MSLQAVKTAPIAQYKSDQTDQMSSKCAAVALAILNLMVAGGIATLLAFTGGPTNFVIFGPGIAAITVSLLIAIALIVCAIKPLKQVKQQKVEEPAFELKHAESLPPNYAHRADPRSPSRVVDDHSSHRSTGKSQTDPASPPAVIPKNFFEHHLDFSPPSAALSPVRVPTEITATSIAHWDDNQIVACLRDIELSDKLQSSYIALVEKLKDLMPPDICKRFAGVPKLYIALAETSVDFAGVLYEVMKLSTIPQRKELMRYVTSTALRERMVNYQMFAKWEAEDREQPCFVERLKKMTNLNCFRDYLCYFDTHLQGNVLLLSPKRQTLMALASPAMHEKLSALDESETYSLSSTFSNLLRYQQCIRIFGGEEIDAFLLMGQFIKLDQDKNLLETLRKMDSARFQNYVRFVDLRYFSGIDKSRDGAFENILSAVAKMGSESWPQVTAPCYEQLLIRFFGTGDLTRNEMEPLLNKCDEEAKVRILRALSGNMFYRYLRMNETGLYENREGALNRFRDLYPIEQMELLSRLKAKYVESLVNTKKSHIHENPAYECIKKVIRLESSPAELLTHIGQTWPQLVAKYMVENWDPNIRPLIDSMWNAMDTEAKQSFYSASFASRQKLEIIPQTLLDYCVKFSLDT